jgi:maltose-binding protein MalE
MNATNKQVNFFITQRNGQPEAELYTETASKVYTYRINPNGKYKAIINNYQEVMPMPNTPKTRVLMGAFNDNIGDILKLLNTEPGQEYNKLYNEIVESLP